MFSFIGRFDNQQLLLALTAAAKRVNSLDVEMAFLNWLFDKNELKITIYFSKLVKEPFVLVDQIH